MHVHTYIHKHLKTKKFAADFCNRAIQTVCPRTFLTSPRIKGQKHTRRRNRADESAATTRKS